MIDMSPSTIMIDMSPSTIMIDMSPSTIMIDMSLLHYQLNALQSTISPALGFPMEGTVVGWELSAVGPGTIKMQVWRRAGHEWKLVGESSVKCTGVVGGEIHPLGEGEDDGAGDFIAVHPGDVIGWQQPGGGTPLLHEQAHMPPQPLEIVQQGVGVVVERIQRTFAVKVRGGFVWRAASLCLLTVSIALFVLACRRRFSWT
jgi:hypothetical protein